MTVLEEQTPAHEDVAPGAGWSARWVIPVVAALVVWVLVRTGPGQVPFLARFEEIARDWPNSPVQPHEGYVLRAPLGQILYTMLGDPGTGRFLQLHLAALVLSAAILGMWLLRRAGSQSGLVSITVLLLSPLPAVLIPWIGMYDAFSVLAWVLLVVALGGNRAWQLAAAIVAGIQNFEQVAIGLVLLALLPELGRAARWRPWMAGLLGGAVAGKVALEVYLGLVGAPSGSRLSFLLDDPSMLRNALLTFALTAPLVVMSALGGLWVFAVPELLRGWCTWSRSLHTRLVLASCLWIGGGILALDHTRGLVLTGVPLLVAGAIVIGRRYGSYATFWRRPEAWVLLLVPPIVVWDRIVLPLGVKLGVWGVGPF